MKIDWRTRSGKAIIATTVIMTILASLITAVFLALMPVTVVSGKPATLNIKVPMGYESTKQTFIKTFPDFTATNLHYSNPYIGGPSGPPATLTLDAGYVSAQATESSLHVTAQMLDFSLVAFGQVLPVARIKCNSVEADVNLWTPDSTGKFGTLVAALKGAVIFYVADLPGLPSGLAGGYSYEGDSLTIKLTYYEPIYTVTVTPFKQDIFQGCKSDFTVTVTPRHADIKGFVDLRWPDELKKNGIHGTFKTGSGTPTLTDTLTIYVEPWVQTGSYPVQVIAHDGITGKDFLSNIVNIYVSESGYTVTIDDQNPFFASIQQGTSQGYKIEVTPLTCYGDGVGLYWRPTSGDFAGIVVELPCGVSPSQEVKMAIGVASGVPTGTREMDVCVFDGGLGREFVCHVTLTVVEPTSSSP